MREEHESSLIEKIIEMNTTSDSSRSTSSIITIEQEEKENFSDYYAQVQFHHEMHAHMRFNVK